MKFVMTLSKMICLFLAILVVSVAATNKLDGSTQNLAYDYDLYKNVLHPELCQQQLQEMNAFEFYDASFRFPQSMLKGNLFSLGNYHQCLDIDQPLQAGSIRGKYCLIQTESLRIPVLVGKSWPGNITWAEVEQVWVNQYLEDYKLTQRELAALSGDSQSRTAVIDIVNSVPFTLAVCIPRSCRVEDVLDPMINDYNYEFNYTVDFCRLPEDKPYSGADIAFVITFSILGCLTVLSTVYELHHIFVKKDSTKANDLWSCFSVYRNTDRLLTLGDSGKPGALDCLDGIRSLSILWVILGHSFLVHMGVYLTNGLDLVEWSSNLRAVYVLATNVSVDSFFVLSGLLLVYTAARKMRQMQLVKGIHLFYLHRLLRMFPLLAAAVLLQASIFHQVTDGVRWNRVAWETQKCRDHWWSALLHLQNIINPHSICLGHSWYLSVDVQLHILSPLLLFWVLGSRRSAWTGLATGVLASLTGVTIYCFIKEFTGEQDTEYTVYFYHNTLARSPPFLIGMLCGYVLHISRRKKLDMPLWAVCLGHVVALVLSGYCMYHVHPDWNSQVWINLNTALMRAAWGASLCWLILACVHGYAGPINWFLSLKLWKFMARISYAMYILHYPMQFITRGANIMPIYFSMENVFINLASDVAYAVIVSVAACVLIDAPCSTLIGKLMTVITPLKKPAQPDKQPEVPESKITQSEDQTEKPNADNQ